MHRARKIFPALAALLLLFAVSGCGDEKTSPPETSPTPTTAVGPTGTTGTSGSTPAAPAGGGAAPKLSGPSKQFAAKLNALCRKHDSSEAEFYYIEVYAKGEVPSEEIDDMAANFRALLRQAGGLNPPAESKAQFQTYLASLRSLVKQMGPLKAAHKSGDADRTIEMDVAFSEELLKRSNAALALGADNCIMDSAY